jgi:hypothetical protein
MRTWQDDPHHQSLDLVTQIKITIKYYHNSLERVKLKILTLLIIEYLEVSPSAYIIIKWHKHFENLTIIEIVKYESTMEPKNPTQNYLPFRNEHIFLDAVTYACKPSNLGIRDWEDCCLSSV